MGRLALNEELKRFIPYVYFQPPENLTMNYPCIVYSKTGKDRKHANDSTYLRKQLYQLMLIEHNPDSEIADLIEDHFPNCVISSYYKVDNLNHTILNLYY